MKSSKELFKEMILNNMKNMEEYMKNDNTIPANIKEQFLKLWSSVEDKDKVIQLAKKKLDKML